MTIEQPIPGEPPRSRMAERTEETRAALVAAARELFAERGYASVGTEEIVRTARLTRGALYHHFTGKEDLFRAVYEELEQEIVQRIAAGASGAADPLEGLRLGTKLWLDACEDPAVQRIALLDAPAVLGWEQWREIGQRYAFGLVQTELQLAIDAGLIDPQPVEPLAHMLLGAIDEAGMLIARADDAGETRQEVAVLVDRLLDAFLKAG
ncbi:MAG TPA: TetR/AcrR family transcriptional regulator [Solirubrobacteraceae bacterium]|jgi:AcrR family transcriptional regulator|nr:TetR/AcrR family transcriptional regulator [Solirubrobacteraceae bacterium]